MTAVLVPQLSLSMEEAKVSRWLVEDGAAVAAGQLVVEVETDKATVELEAQSAGVLRIVAAEGAIVAVDGVLAELEPAAPPVADEERTDASRYAADCRRRAVGSAGRRRRHGTRARSHRPLPGGSPASEGSSSRRRRAPGPADGSWRET